MARALRFREILSILTKEKVWHIPLKNLFSLIRRYSGKSHQNLNKKIVKTTQFVRDVAIYWLNALQRPNKKTVRGNRNQELVDLNQDLPYTLSQFNQDLALNMYSKKWLDWGQFLIKPWILGLNQSGGQEWEGHQFQKQDDGLPLNLLDLNQCIGRNISMVTTHISRGWDEIKGEDG